MKEAFRKTALLGLSMMVVATAVVQRWPSTILSVFEANKATETAAVVFLAVRLMVARGPSRGVNLLEHIPGCRNTVSSVVSSGARFVAFIVTVTWLTRGQSLTSCSCGIS